MDFKKIKTSFQPYKGSLLVSEPFLNDMQFRRTVVLLGEHNEEGSAGFILNRLLNITTGSLVPDLLDINFPLFYGGPVEPNTLHFIHTVGELITGAQPVGNGIYWGGDLDLVNDLLKQKIVHPSEFKFFVGYSGWESEQLDEEMNQKAWWVAAADKEIVFDDDLDNMWARIVKTLGADYAHMANSPEDLRWN